MKTIWNELLALRILIGGFICLCIAGIFKIIMIGMEFLYELFAGYRVKILELLNKVGYQVIVTNPESEP